ncbi:hypothetical protein PCH_Pc21g22420 [Penicillium rubens Wisconsin 54-1255]|uniref:Uncharacterized protein n=1 Tax=Penicillium rubens (strain ATCC 28089 / DSM 1075 / NRRL 1951 / Wisconsin 54-1255) TaxID=500485 RepID=B6HNF1_PENRW|nr:hypothetical protein PCH_Pc21g22420 [Penicillium rubens Wisconsin 54-1255]
MSTGKGQALTTSAFMASTMPTPFERFVTNGTNNVPTWNERHNTQGESSLPILGTGEGCTAHEVPHDHKIMTTARDIPYRSAYYAFSSCPSGSFTFDILATELHTTTEIIHGLWYQAPKEEGRGAAIRMCWSNPRPEVNREGMLEY